MLPSKPCRSFVAFAAFVALTGDLTPSLAADDAGAAPKGEPKKEKPKGSTAVHSDVPVEQLIEINKAALFGSDKVAISGDDVEIVLDKAAGQLGAAFEGSNLVDSVHEKMKGTNRKFIQYGDQKGGEKLLPGLLGVAMEEGTWQSKFRLAGATKVAFDMRIPNLLTIASNMKVRLNWDKTSGIETNFLTSIARVSGGSQQVLAQAKDPAYRKSAGDWFPRKGEPVHVEFGFEGDQCVVRFSGKEIVSIAKLKDAGGHVGFSFKKILFTIQNLKVTGKLDREWCQGRLADLEKKGKLLTTKPPEKGIDGAAPPPATPPPAEGKEEGKDDGKGEGGEKK